MKKFKQKCNFIILLTFCFVSVNSQEVNSFDVKGNRNGFWQGIYDDTKHIRYEGTFKNGKEIGLFTYFTNSANKTIMATRNFDAKNNAYTIFYDEKKNVVSEGNVNKKKRNGIWKYYHKNSKSIMNIENYNNDLLEGVRKVFYKNGVVAEEVIYKNNLKNGVSKIFTDKGKLKEEANYLNNEFEGLYKIYDEAGNIEVIGNYKNGMKKGIWKYYANGKLIKEENKDIKRKVKVEAKPEGVVDKKE